MRFTAFNLSAMLPDTVSRRPLVAVAAGVLLGLACGYEPPDLSPWLLAASMLVWLVAEFRKTTLRLVVRLCFCGMLAGFASADIDLRLRASEFNRLHSVQKNETFVCRIGNPVKVRRTLTRSTFAMATPVTPRAVPRWAVPVRLPARALSTGGRSVR